MRRSAWVVAIWMSVAACGRKPAPAPAPLPGGGGAGSRSCADAAALLAEAEAAMRRGDGDAAFATLREALAADPRLAPAWMRYHELMAADGRGAEVRTEFASRLASSPEDPLWLALCAVTDAEDRSARLEKAARLGPELAWVHYIRSEVHMEARRFEEAFRAADRALQLEPQNAMFRAHRALSLELVGRSDEAAEEGKKARDSAPGDERVRLRYAQVLEMQDRTEEAIEELAEAARIAPRATGPRKFLADLRERRARSLMSDFASLMDSGHFGAAAKAAEESAAQHEQALKDDPGNEAARKYLPAAETAAAAAWLKRAGVDVREENLKPAAEACDMARTWLRKAGKRDLSAEARRYLAEIWLGLGAIRLGLGEGMAKKGIVEAREQYQAALDGFEACLEFDPECRTAVQMADEARKKLR
jgi:tetratricopeptide (TPR) repeat protein